MNKPIYILFLFLGFIVANESPEWTTIPDKVIDEDCISCTDFPIDLNDYLSDPDPDDILTVEVTEVTGATFAVDENLLLDIGLDSDFYGDINVELTASDGEFTPTTTFNITVNPINDAPTFLNLGNITLEEDRDSVLTWAFDISSGPVDENDILEFFVDFEENNIIESYQLESDGEFSINLLPDANGSVDFSVYLSDGEAVSETVSKECIVSPVNDRPFFENEGNIVIDEDQVYNDQWATLISPGAENEVDDDLFLQVNLVDDPGNIIQGYTSEIPIETGILSIEPQADQYGVATFEAFLTDFLLDSDIVSFTYTLNSVDDPPEWTDIPDQNINEDCDAQICEGATELFNVADYVDDVDNDLDELTFEVGDIQLSPNDNAEIATFSIEDDNIIRLESLTQHYFGVITVEVTASDGVNGPISKTFNLNVNSINDPPIFENLGDISWNEDQEYNQSWAYNVSPGAYNESDENLSFSIEFAADNSDSSRDDPNWEGSFDGTAYEFTATLANAQVFIDGQVKTTGKLAAFVGDEVRGIDLDGSNFFPPGGTNIWEVSLYSNLVSGETITFKYYDDVNDVIIDLNETIAFETNAIYGSSAFEPFEFSGSTNSSIPAPIESYTFEYSDGIGTLNIISIADDNGTGTFSVVLSDGEDENDATDPVDYSFTVNPVNDPPFDLVQTAVVNDYEDCGIEPWDLDCGNCSQDPGGFDPCCGNEEYFYCTLGEGFEFEETGDWYFECIEDFYHQYREMQCSEESNYIYTEEFLNSILDVSDIDSNNDDITFYIDYDEINLGGYDHYTISEDGGIIVDHNYHGDILIPVYAQDTDGTDFGGVDTSINFDFTVTIDSVNDIPVIEGDSVADQIEDCDEPESLTNGQFSIFECEVNSNAFIVDLIDFNPDDTADGDTSFSIYIDGDLPDDAPYSVSGNQVVFDPHYHGQVEIPVYITDSLGDLSDVYNLEFTVNPVNDFPDISLLESESVYEDCEDVSLVQQCEVGLFTEEACLNASDETVECDWNNVNDICMYVQSSSQECSVDNQLWYIYPGIEDSVVDVDDEHNPDDFTYNVTPQNDDNFSSFIDIDDSGNHNLIIVPEKDYNGEVIVDLEVDDGIHSSNDSFVLSVVGLNDGPDDVDPPSDSVDLDEDFGEYTVFDLDDKFSDIEEDLNLNFSYEIVSGATVDQQLRDIEISINSDNQLVLTSVDNQYTIEQSYDDNCDGQVTDEPIVIDLIARDNFNRAEVRFPLTINITAKNDTPEWSVSAVEDEFDEDCGADDNQPCSNDYADDWYQKDLRPYIVSVDRDNGCLSDYTYTIVNNQDLVSASHEAIIVDGFLYLKPDFNFSGNSIDVRVIADDNYNLADEFSSEDSTTPTELELSIYITPINDGPQISGGDDWGLGDVVPSIDEDGALSFNIASYISDVEDDIALLQYSLSLVNLDNGVYFDDIDVSSDGNFTIDPIDDYNVADLLFSFKVDDFCAGENAQWDQVTGVCRLYNDYENIIEYGYGTECYFNGGSWDTRKNYTSWTLEEIS